MQPSASEHLWCRKARGRWCAVILVVSSHNVLPISKCSRRGFPPVLASAKLIPPGFAQ